MVHRNTRRPGFTLIEVLVVIGIVLVLVSILIPVVNRVQKSAQAANTQSLIAAISGAIDQYKTTFNAYPGPIPNDQIYTVNTSPAVPAPAIFDSLTNAQMVDASRITMNENVVLGLCGGLKFVAPNVTFDRTLVGSGPRAIPPTGAVKAYPPFLQAADLTEIKPGAEGAHFSDGAGDANDSQIPEFVDRFSHPMPLLILRCRRGVPMVAAPTTLINSVITDVDANGQARTAAGPYDLSQIIAYTGAFTGAYPALARDNGAPAAVTGGSIGEGKDISEYYVNAADSTPVSGVPKPSHGLRTVNFDRLGPGKAPGPNYYLPYDAYPYFQNPSVPNTPRQKDGYIIISAGKDRVYGTDDDLTNFGSVVP